MPINMESRVNKGDMPKATVLITFKRNPLTATVATTVSMAIPVVARWLARQRAARGEASST